MRAIVWTGAAACVLWMAGAVQGAVVLQLDVQPAGKPTPAGFVEVTNAPRWDQSSQLVLPDNIQVGWTGYLDSGLRDRATSDPLTSELLDIGAGKPAETLLIAGLPAGIYSLTLWAFDPAYPTKWTEFGIDGDDNGLAELSLRIDNNLGEESKTVPVTVSAAGKLAITVDGVLEGGTNYAGCFNGLVLTPEPTTLGLLAFGGLSLLRRHRR